MKLRNGKVTVHGRYGIYEVAPEKAEAYFEYLKTPEGKRWAEGCDNERREWDKNMQRILQHNKGGGDSE